MSDVDKEHRWSRLWNKVAGSPEIISENNRVVNAVLAITVAFMLVSVITNITARLYEPFLISAVLMVLLVIVYYLSRFRGMYKMGFMLYACAGYVTMIVTYLYNAGMDGPVLFLFYLTFHLIITISPKKQHFLWMALHLIIGFLLLSVEHFCPRVVLVRYDSITSRYIDLAFSYVSCLLFIYLLTTYLRKRYERQKEVAEQHAEEASEHYKKLEHISWMQSHMMRKQVATILGHPYLRCTHTLLSWLHNPHRHIA